MTKCFEINADVYMASLQIRSTSISHTLPIPAMPLFNRLTRGILYKSSGPLVLYDNNVSGLVLLETWCQTSQDIDTHKNILFLPTASPLAVYREDGGLWKHRMIKVHKTGDHNGRINRVTVTKTGHVTTRLEGHTKANNLFVEDYCYVMQAVLCVNCLGDKCLSHATLMNTALIQLLIFRFSYLVTNKGIAQCIDNSN